MSFFGKLFGKANDKDAVSTGEAIQKLRETEEMLMKKQDFLEKKIDQEVATAKKNAKTNKRAAMQALKRKKRYDKQLQQIDGTLSTIEMQREALEGANTNTAVLTTMNDAAKALKKANADLDVDKVHDMMDDIAEQQDVAKEISEAISNPVAFGQEFDEDELEAELDALGEELELEEQEELDKQLLDVGPIKTLPDVPSAVPANPQPAAKKKETEEDPDMAELAAWASQSDIDTAPVITDSPLLSPIQMTATECVNEYECVYRNQQCSEVCLLYQYYQLFTRDDSCQQNDLFLYIENTTKYI